LTSHGSNNSGLKLEKFTADNFFDKNISISQPENGYRFSMDPFILASQVQVKESKKIIDIGTGCAIIPLILSSKHPDLKIIGIEIQEELATFAKRNVVANKLENTIQIIFNDIKNIKSSDMDGKADIIVSNPPYKKKNSGRLNPDSQKAIARHEIALDIDTLFDCSNRL
jgi:tRNA1Val (adenine37-N6)-methyltransferase